MSLLDLIRQEYVKGRVTNKYTLGNGNVGLIVEDEAARKRYHVEFKDYRRGPCIENMFGLLKDPFEGKTEPVNKLIKEGDTVELTLSYSRGPLREAYYIHSVSGKEQRDDYRDSRRLIALPYRGQASRY